MVPPRLRVAARLPPPTSAGLFLPATPALKAGAPARTPPFEKQPQPQKPLRGQPLALCKAIRPSGFGSPTLCAVPPKSFARRPFPFATPRVRHLGVLACAMPPLRKRTKQRQQQKREEAMQDHSTSYTQPLHMAAFRQRADGRLHPRRGHRRPLAKAWKLLRRYGNRLLLPLWRSPRTHIPVELVGEEFRDLTTTHITPVLDWHDAKYHPRRA